ncbi:Alpha/Beta hydrolase protein [Aspergillus desertorum]
MATFDPAHPKFKGFDLIQATYKSVGDHAIRVDVLVPQTPARGQRPTIVRFHGGGLVMADSLFVDFWPQWLSDLALHHNAIIVSPNYRFMPQATGLEIYDDIEDFWAWLRSPALQELLARHETPTEIDLERILVDGESAGGLLSVNTSLAHAPEIRATIALYPTLDPSSPDFVKPRTDLLPFGQHLPETLINEVLDPVCDGGPVSSLVAPEYVPVMCAAIQYGRLGEWYARGSEESERRNLLYPVRRLAEPEVQIPVGGITIIQGKQDSVVPAHHSVPFVERAREVLKGKRGGDKISLVLREGEHGFDGEVRYEESWMKDALKAAVEAWLA